MPLFHITLLKSDYQPGLQLVQEAPSSTDLIIVLIGLRLRCAIRNATLLEHHHIRLSRIAGSPDLAPYTMCAAETSNIARQMVFARILPSRLAWKQCLLILQRRDGTVERFSQLVPTRFSLDFAIEAHELNVQQIIELDCVYVPSSELKMAQYMETILSDFTKTVKAIILT